MLILAIGDLHIPDRATGLPQKFHKLLVPGKISQVLCLGNVTSSPTTLEFLKNLSSDFQIVKGEFDENTNLPLSLVVTHGNLRIGFTNGYTIVPRGDPLSLLTSARQMNVDVLIWGGTHKVETYTLEGKFFINPGSATGAFSTEWPDLEDLEEEGKSSDTADNSSKQKLDAKENGSHENLKEGDSAPDDSQSSESKREVNNPDEDADDEDADDEDDLESQSDSIPSFTLLDIQGSVITLYIYTYIAGEVKVDKVSYRKDQS